MNRPSVQLGSPKVLERGVQRESLRETRAGSLGLAGPEWSLKEQEASYRHRWGEAGPRSCAPHSDTAAPHCPAGCIQGHS